VIFVADVSEELVASIFGAVEDVADILQSVTSYESTRRHVPQGCNLQLFFCYLGDTMCLLLELLLKAVKVNKCLAPKDSKLY
jgi:hypothetical protein